jgi:hypothetical protein
MHVYKLLDGFYLFRVEVAIDVEIDILVLLQHFSLCFLEVSYVAEFGDPFFNEVEIYSFILIVQCIYLLATESVLDDC